MITTPAQAAPVEKPTFDGLVTVAGTGEHFYSGDGRPAVEARIGESPDIDVAPDGSLYIADYMTFRLRRVDDRGVIHTVPGSRGPMPSTVAVGPGGRPYFGGQHGVYRQAGKSFQAIGGQGHEHFYDGNGGDGGPATEAYLSEPTIAVDRAGTVYAASESRIRKIDRSGTIRTIAGGGSLTLDEADGKPATRARLGKDYHDIQLAADAKGNVYFTVEEERALYRVDRRGRLHTVVGAADIGYSGDGGPAEQAEISAVRGFDVDRAGNVYLVDAGNNDVDLDASNSVVRKIDANGVISTVSPRLAELDGATDLALGREGEVYVATAGYIKKLATADADPDDAGPAAGRPLKPAGGDPFADAEAGAVKTIIGTGRAPKRPELSRSNASRDVGSRKRAAAGPDGTLYYAHAATHRVIAVRPDGTVERFAGTGSAGDSGDGGPAAEAKLDTPSDVAVDRSGRVYVADFGNNKVRRVDADGVITTVAGSGAVPQDAYEADADLGDGGPATAAKVLPIGVAVGRDGTLFIADHQGYRIRAVDRTGKIRTLAGAGEVEPDEPEAEGRPAKDIALYDAQPDAIAVDGRGNVFFTGNDLRRPATPAVWRISRSGEFSTLTGGATRTGGGFAGDRGPARKGELNNPTDLAAGADGEVYIADSYNSRIRVVRGNGKIETVAGTGEATDTGDDGPARKAAVDEPQSVAVGPRGVLHLINAGGDSVRTIDSGRIARRADLADAESIMDNGDGDPAAATPVEFPQTLSFDGRGTLYVQGMNGPLRSVRRDGTVDSPLATSGPMSGPTSISAAIAGPDGSLYVASRTELGAEIVNVRRPDGSVRLLAGGGNSGRRGADADPDDQRAVGATIGQVSDLAVSPKGVLYIATTDRVVRLSDDGMLATVHRMKPTLGRDHGITTDGQGRLYVADNGAGRVYRVDDAGRKTVVAGTDERYGFNPDEDNGEDATEVPLQPRDVAVDRDGTLYISDSSNLYRVDHEDNSILRLTGEDANDGYAAYSIALDPDGNLYFADWSHHKVQVLVRPDEISGPFPWDTVWTVLGVGAGVLVVGGLYLWHRRETTGGAGLTDGRYGLRATPAR